MNTISSIKTCRSSNKKTYTLSTFTLPSSLAFYLPVIENEVDTDSKKVGEYVTKTWLNYYGTNMISTTDIPSSITNSNIGSYILTDANNYVDLTGSSVTYTSGQSITICFWFKLNSVTGSGSVKYPFRLGSIAFSNDVIAPEFTYNASGQLTNLFVYALNASGARFSNTLTNLLTWNHFAIIFTHGAVPQLYVNGSTLYNSSNGTNSFNSTITSSGGRTPHNTSTIPPANLTELRIYKEALSQTRIQNIYNWNGTGQPTY